MLTTLKPMGERPYSLHDRRVADMKLDGDTLRVSFENGLARTDEPEAYVEGAVEVRGVDPEEAFVYLLGAASAKKRKFKGRRMSVRRFRKKYADASFEIIDELYDWNRLCWYGWLWRMGKNPVEAMLKLYHTGEIVYDTED